MDAVNIKIEVEKKNGNSAVASFTNLADAEAFLDEHAKNLGPEETPKDGEDGEKKE